MTSLQKFYFRDNLFSGAIPSELGLFKDVIRFFIDTNAFTSTLPIELCSGGHDRLADFSVGNSAITGSLASECFSDWPSLAGLWAQETGIGGPIPTELGLLVDTLTTLNVANTSLTGTLPEELAGLSNLQAFNVEGTMISGTIPTNICEIPDLRFGCTGTLCGCSCVCDST